MSKMYKRYLELKQENKAKIYLFKSGIFNIFLDDDAKLMSNILNLRLTNLNENVLKCGFPVNNLSKYLNIIKNSGHEVNIIDNLADKPLSSKNYLLNSSINNLIEKLVSTNSNELSIKEAYCLIDSLVTEAIQIRKETENR